MSWGFLPRAYFVYMAHFGDGACYSFLWNAAVVQGRRLQRRKNRPDGLEMSPLSWTIPFHNQGLRWPFRLGLAVAQHCSTPEDVPAVFQPVLF